VIHYEMREKQVTLLRIILLWLESLMFIHLFEDITLHQGYSGVFETIRTKFTPLEVETR